MRLAPRPVAALVSFVVIGVVALISILMILPPSPAGADAPADEFSAARAFEHVREIGSEVHVTGSPTAAAVRDHIANTLTDLGYEPQVRAGIGEMNALGTLAAAYVENIVVRIPGTAPTGQVILMAHYDSVQVSYGANDDGSGTAVLLETARALTQTEPLANDVIFLFTDAEEACLCGAAAFVDSDPLAAGGGVVLNFEARGANGPSVMFETAAGNSALVAEYAAAVPYPVATSMAVEVYRILPNDTDFTPFRVSGDFTGLNSAYIDGVPVYHSPQDRPEYLNQGTLQAHGSNALALARHLGTVDLTDLALPGAQDATYFPVFGTLLRYPGALVWPLAILALVAVALLALTVRTRERVGWGRLAGGFGLMLAPIIGAALVAQGLWAALVALRPGYGQLIDPWQPTWFRLGLVALVAFITVGWYALWRRRFTPWGLATGAMGWLAIIGLAMAAVTPGGSYLAALPALAGAIAAVVAIIARSWWIRVAVIAIAGSTSAVILAPIIVLFFPALGLATGAAAALMTVFLALALLPAIEFLHPPLPRATTSPPSDGDVPVGPSPIDQSTAAGHRRRRAALPAAVLLVAGVAFTGVGLAVDGFDADHPQPTQLMYALDADTGTAYWASEQDDAHGWLTHYFTGSADLSESFPFLTGELLTGPASAADIGAPDLSVQSDTTNGSIRTLSIAVEPRADARLFQLDAPDATVLSATVTAAGITHTLTTANTGFSLLFHAAPADGVTVTLILDGTDPVTVRLSDGSDGLDHLPGFRPRPADVGVKGSHTSELAMVARTFTL